LDLDSSRNSSPRNQPLCITAPSATRRPSWPPRTASPIHARRFRGFLAPLPAFLQRAELPVAHCRFFSQLWSSSRSCLLTWSVRSSRSSQAAPPPSAGDPIARSLDLELRIPALCLRPSG
jgi:hypothetical protein